MTITESIADQADIDAHAGRLFEAGLASIELMTVYLGARLGLYEQLASSALTIRELADRTGVHPRYTQEWLEQQTVAGVVACDDRNLPLDERRFSLPAAWATVLLEVEHPAYSAPLGLLLAGVASVLPELLVAYRSGSGVPFANYGTDLRDGQAGFNRPAFTHLLAQSWLAEGAAEVDTRLRSSIAPRIADVACGAGWSSIAMSRAYPNATIDGFDIDDASIADARAAAAAAAVEDHVRFEVADAAKLAAQHAGKYDMVTIFEAVHDMSDPVGALRACRAMCAPGGSVIVMDERTADSFAESDGPVERFLYGASVLHCLPVGLADQPSVGTGTVMRADTLRGYAAEAGFAIVDVLDIEHDLFRFYHLLP